MNITQQLGQLMMIGLQGTALLEEESNFLKNENIGGVILFAHNYEAPGQLAELVNDIQKCRDEYPLFVAVDNEGGRVFRFKNQFTHFPAMLDIAQLDSPKLIYEVHQIMARELMACGVNLNFSPVCDIWSNPQNKVIADRAFGKTAEVVEKFVSAAIRGLHAEKVVACAKHFPGHGSTKKDSHYDLPFVSIDEAIWMNTEYIPFARAAKSRVNMMMMAHIVSDMFDKKLPCTLSLAAYKKLRTLLKFNKIIITDDMEMKAIMDHHTVEDAGIMALNAGADIILYRSFATGVKVYNALKNAVSSNIIDREIFLPKLNRIVEVKQEFLNNYQPVYIPEVSRVVAAKEHVLLLQEIKSKLHLK